MISVESQVLQRYFAQLNQKSLLFAGGITDDFPMQLSKDGEKVQIWSFYFDYAREKSAVTFSSLWHGNADLIIFYWTKNKQEVQFQLNQLLSQSPIGQEILIVGENRCGVRSAEKMLEKFGEIAKIDSARRCSLYHFCLQKPPHFLLSDYFKSYQHIQLKTLNVGSYPGVFSATELDAGTSLLLTTLQNNIHGDVLDLGCGIGVIGLYIKQNNPNIKLTMSDIHALALESARENAQRNHLPAEIVASDVFSHLSQKFDLIISNPPFHSGVDTAYRAVTELITQAKWHLKQGGELRIVANAFLPYPDLLDQHFGSHQVLAKNGKFKVYSVIN